MSVFEHQVLIFILVLVCLKALCRLTIVSIPETKSVCSLCKFISKYCYSLGRRRDSRAFIRGDMKTTGRKSSLCGMSGIFLLRGTILDSKRFELRLLVKSEFHDVLMSLEVLCLGFFEKTMSENKSEEIALFALIFETKKPASGFSSVGKVWEGIGRECQHGGIWISLESIKHLH